jgi:serine-type D-Ala-D-Ala endopeptidase (penicillin-binding protein 7)
VNGRYANCVIPDAYKWSLLYIVASKLQRLTDNPLVVYELSATISLIRPPALWIRLVHVNTKPAVRLSLVTLVALLSIGVSSTSAATKTKSQSSVSSRAASASPSRKRPLYSSQRSLAQRARLARARALASEMADTTLPRYKVDASGDLVPDVRAAAAVIYNPETNEILWEENAQDQRSIASITKVMTATVFLENDPDPSQVITIDRSDVFRASTTLLRRNDRVTVDDLLHLLLIASDNAAARALARVSPHGSDGFVQRMNDKASQLGLTNTHYADPSGLLSENVSSAFDMARLITHASGDERIASVMRTPDYTLQTAAGRTLTFRSTNHLLGRSDVDVRAGKTGFISKSGYCLATLLRLPDSDRQVAVVVLGARSNAGRFMETRNLFNWLSVKASTLFATETTVPALPQ